MAEVYFLGTGNAFSPPGRMHALALIDSKILIDCPPTVIPQLIRGNCLPSELKHLLITHWHADHTFGLPFLLLNRKWMPSEESDGQELEIHLEENGIEILSNLCRIGYPGTLEDSLEKDIIWNKDKRSKLIGTEWEMERFPVRHTPETEPHGYMLTHSCGFRLLHCGDSGPCEEIDYRVGQSDVVIVEMGVPDYVDSPYHHKPSDVEDLSNKYPGVKILVTHNYSNSGNFRHGFKSPNLSSNIHQLDDGNKLIINGKGDYILKK